VEQLDRAFRAGSFQPIMDLAAGEIRHHRATVAIGDALSRRSIISGAWTPKEIGGRNGVPRRAEAVDDFVERSGDAVLSQSSRQPLRIIFSGGRPTQPTAASRNRLDDHGSDWWSGNAAPPGPLDIVGEFGGLIRQIPWTKGVAAARGHAGEADVIDTRQVGVANARRVADPAADRLRRKPTGHGIAAVRGRSGGYRGRLPGSAVIGQRGFLSAVVEPIFRARNLVKKMRSRPLRGRFSGEAARRNRNGHQRMAHVETRGRRSPSVIKVGARRRPANSGGGNGGV